MIITKGFGSFGIVVLKGFNGYIKDIFNNQNKKVVQEKVFFKSLITYKVNLKVNL